MTSTPLFNKVEQMRQRAQERCETEGAEQPTFDLGEQTTRPASGDSALQELNPELAALDAIDRRNRGLIPKRHLNRDFFLCDLSEIAIKDDAVTMEAPVFSLKKQKDITEWRWTSPDNKRVVEVIPSMRGRATIYDKDVLIFITSQITEGLNRGRNDAENKRVRFIVYDYLTATNKTSGGREYERLEAALDRLKGTTIKTNIETGGIRIKQSFSIIDRWETVEKSPTDERMIAVEVTISDWLYNAIQDREVLTLDSDYFRLRKPLEKRLYEIARKHCGDKAMFAIGEDKLYNKSGSTATPNHFRDDVKEIAADDNLPQYRYSLDKEKGQWIIYTKNQKKLSKAITDKVRTRPSGIVLSGKKS